MGHNLRSCPEPCNQDRINKARASHHENKKPGGSKPSGAGGGGSKYCRGKFGKPPARGETVRYINEKPHSWCGTCGWVTTHSTKYHDNWNSNKGTFVLYDKHPLSLAKLDGKKSGLTKTKGKTTEGGGKPHAGLSLAALGDHFAKMEIKASDPTQANMAQVLKNLFQGKV
jgi:hypothetical protein